MTRDEMADLVREMAFAHNQLIGLIINQIERGHPNPNMLRQVYRTNMERIGQRPGGEALASAVQNMEQGLPPMS